MEDGEVFKWLGRVDVIFKEKAIWKSQVVLEDCDRSKFSVTCQWHSPVVGSRDLEYTFQEVRDRLRYSLAHCIGLVRIDFSDSDEGGIRHISGKNEYGTQRGARRHCGNENNKKESPRRR